MRPTILLRSLLLLLATWSPLLAQFGVDFVEYHDVSSASHQLQFTQLSSQGYRPISLSVAGSRTSARYTAVWIRRAGPTFVGVHGVDATGYLAWRVTQQTAGFRPLLLACAGNDGSEVYASVWVADGVDAVDTIEESSTQFEQSNARSYNDDLILTRVSVRQTGSNSWRFASIREPNVDEDAWCWDYSSPSEYSTDFQVRTGSYGRLVTAIVIAPATSIGQLWHDSSVGAFSVRTSLTTAQLVSEIAAQRQNGLYPTSITQTGTSIAARYEVVFSQRDQKMPRQLTRTGTIPLPLAAFDAYMEEHVRSQGPRSATIAITKDGRLVMAVGYTFAEAGYRTTQPTDLFRVASLSKIVSGLAVNLLIQRGGTISQSTPFAPYLGVSGIDPDWDDITVLQLLRHRSGLGSDITSFGVAQTLNQASPLLPATQAQTISALSRYALSYDPDTQSRYSNAGYYVLGGVIERAAGKSYERFLREDLAAPLGITRMWIAGNERADQRPGEVEVRNRFLELTPSELHTDRRIVPVQFGGGGDDNLTRRAAAGGVLTSAVDFVRLFSGALDLVCDGSILDQAAVDRMLAPRDPRGGANSGGFDTRDVRANGVIAWGKDGALWGSSTQFIYRSDGVAIAVFDGYQNSHASRDRLNELADAVSTWPTFDLFPNYGLQPFQRTCPRIHDVANDTLANVTDQFVSITGDVFSGVDRVSFGGTSVTSRSSTTWTNGWFDIVDDDHLELHIPQGLMPGSYQVRLHNGFRASDPFTVNVTRATGRVLGGPASSFVGFDLIASRGASSPDSSMLLCYSTSSQSSLLPGIVDLGIGANFSQLWTFPAAISVNPLTGCARWSVPDLGNLQLHFQAVVIDPRSIFPFPLLTTNVRSVRGI